MKEINGFVKGEQKAWLELHAACLERHLPKQEVYKGQVIDMGGDVMIEVLGVAEPECETSVQNININNHSVVMQLRYGKFSMMFTGDAVFEQKARILSEGKDLTSDILKVSHHAGDGGAGKPWLHALAP